MTNPGGPPENSLSTARPRLAPNGAGALPNVESPLSPQEFIQRVGAASKAGRLPGFARDRGDAFRVAALAGVFDHDVHGSCTRGRGSEVTFELRARRRLPAIMILAVAVSFWPGLPITDSMLRLYFPAYHEWGVETWWWYIPLVIISIPPIWKVWKTSRRQAHEEALKVIARIAAATDGVVR